MTDFKALDKFFENKSFISGERLSVADLAFVSSIKSLYDSNKLDSKAKDKFTNFVRYYNTIVNQPEFKKAEDLKVFTVAASAPKPAKAAQSGDAKPAAAATGEDLLDQIEKAESKSKDPFNDFPVGNFVLDDFKRKYSNFPPVESIPYFWEKFDPEHYSIWFCDYKYNDELGLAFMSCNLIKGMFQRLDKMRKNSFGSVCLFGEDHKSIIAGLWIWRGQGLAFELSPDWQVDYESYAWRKLDPKADETKQLVDTFFKQEGEYNGYKINDGRIFK